MKFLRLFSITLLITGQAFAADIPGGKDHSLLKRFSGSEIIGYQAKNYDEYILALAGGAPGTGFGKEQHIEGKLTRILYRVPAGHTTIEVFRNYENMLKTDGFEPLFSQAAQGFEWPGYFNEKFYLQSHSLSGRETNPLSSGTTKEQRYQAVKKAVNGKDTFIAVLITESTGTKYFPPAGKDDKDGIAIAAGDLVVAVDVVETDKVDDSMVKVKAEDMAKTLAEKGKVDLYGIYFDVDKTEVKPESAPTLEQVAKLLKDMPDLKLQVGGHTDNTGDKAHNQTLSEGRAQAVVKALTSPPYAAPAARLVAKGFGDTQPVADNGTEAGKAKNRRVELSKQ